VDMAAVPACRRQCHRVVSHASLGVRSAPPAPRASGR
jgi:hypothetical protein